MNLHRHHLLVPLSNYRNKFRVVSPMIFVPNQLVGAPAGTDVTIDCNTEAHPKYVKNPFHIIFFKNITSRLRFGEHYPRARVHVAISFFFLSLSLPLLRFCFFPFLLCFCTTIHPLLLHIYHFFYYFYNVFFCLLSHIHVWQLLFLYVCVSLSDAVRFDYILTLYSREAHCFSSTSHIR